MSFLRIADRYFQANDSFDDNEAYKREIVPKIILRKLQLNQIRIKFQSDLDIRLHGQNDPEDDE
jgi:hypothetical protein